MRKSILLSCVLLISCDEAPTTYTVLPDIPERSRTAACEPVRLDGDPALDMLRGASDTTFVVLDAAQRRVTLYDDRLSEVWTMEYQEYGPGEVKDPEAVALLGDTVAIATRNGLRLVLLDRHGDLVRTQNLGFIPNAMTATPERDLLITARPIGSSPSTLLFRYRDEVVESYDVPLRPYGDMSVGALGNSTVPVALGDGQALVIHQFYEPAAYLVDIRTGEMSSVAAPTPEATRANIDFVPTPPITPEQYPEILIPAYAADIDRSTGKVYVMTKSGRTVNGVEERLLLRLDAQLGYEASWTLGASVSQLAVLPRQRSVVVAGRADDLYRCRLDG